MLCKYCGSESVTKKALSTRNSFTSARINWKTLIEQATKHEAKLLNNVISQKNQTKEPVMKVIAK